MMKNRKWLVVIVTVFILAFMSASAVMCQADSAVRISKKKVTVLVSKSVKLSVKGTTSKVQWSSSDASVAKVSAKGKVTGKKAGKAVITATVDSETLTCKVTVRIGLDKKKVSLKVGETVKVKLCGTKIKKARSANVKVAKANKRGKITAIGKGKTTITFTGKNNKKYKCKVKVKGGAVPEPGTYVIDFDSAGGTSIPSQTVMEGEKVSVPDIPSLDGYVFDHWEWNGAAFDFSTPVTSSMTLTAKWTTGTWEDSEEVLQIVDASIAPGVETEAQVIHSFEERGFSDHETKYPFSINGEYYDDGKASESSSEKRPIYNTLFVSNSGILWSIYSVNGEVIAYPASYLLDSGSDKEIFVSEKDQIISYDNETNKFFVTKPDPSKVIVKVVDRVDKETLNMLTYEELGKL